MPPVLDVALDELASRSPNDVLARDRRPRVKQGQDALKLIPESLCTAARLEGRPAPAAAGERLKQPPMIEYRVERRLGRPYSGYAQPFGPCRDGVSDGFPRALHVAVLRHEAGGFGLSVSRAQQKNDFAGLAGRQLDRALERRAGIESRAGRLTERLGTEPVGMGE